MTLWSGRFKQEPAQALWDFTTDPSDRRMLTFDVRGSIAHVEMLGAVGLLPDGDVATLLDGLAAILREAEAGEFAFHTTDEDVHSAVERRLGEIVGDVAGKLHTGRSRNDQVCLDLRLYLRAAAVDRVAQLESFVRALVDAADRAGDDVVPSYTHLQQAQAIPLAHHLLAYGWMLVRDIDRFRRAAERMSVSPLGAGAAAGSSLPLDPARTARGLGFDVVFANSLDAVGSRDFVADYAFCCAQAMTHLSRLSEDLILWSTAEFGWATFGDAFTTGSSALPHKKNPDIAELARGKAATVIGDVTALLTLQKGLPLTYNRDLQEDKRAVFHADDALRLALTALEGMVGSATFHPPPPSSWVTALDLAEALVERGVPFREAHEAVGRLVHDLAAAGRELSSATAGELEAAHVQLVPEDLTRLDPVTSVERRTVPGGGSFDAVLRQIDALRGLVGRG